MFVEIEKKIKMRKRKGETAKVQKKSRKKKVVSVRKVFGIKIYRNIRKKKSSVQIFFLLFPLRCVGVRVLDRLRFAVDVERSLFGGTFAVLFVAV